MPLVVKPEFQNLGVGSKLIEEGLNSANDLRYKSVFVVGDPNYYGRFGFKSVTDISNNIGVSPNHLMFIELEKDALSGISGILTYPAVFKEL